MRPDHPCPNRLFVARKPPGIGSNAYLSRLKRRYGVKKAGFSGTLDPFAKGTLIVAFGQYTKLFRFLDKTPKTYRATLWLGAHSPTLDIEKIARIDTPSPFDPKRIAETVEAFAGEFSYTPPAFSAKKIDGRRAYEIARRGEAAQLATVTSTIYKIRLLHYRHPFVTFEATVSEGTYIRSLGEAIARRLGCAGALSALERVREGRFVYDAQKPLDPLDYLVPPPNRYLGEAEDLHLGRPLAHDRLALGDAGVYHLCFDDYFAIIEITQRLEVRYLLNKVKRC